MEIFIPRKINFCDKRVFVTKIEHIINVFNSWSGTIIHALKYSPETPEALRMHKKTKIFDFKKLSFFSKIFIKMA